MSGTPARAWQRSVSLRAFHDSALLLLHGGSLVYLWAFASAFVQLPGTLHHTGLTPANVYLHRRGLSPAIDWTTALNLRGLSRLADALREFPSVLVFVDGDNPLAVDRALDLCCLAGIVVALVVQALPLLFGSPRRSVLARVLYFVCTVVLWVCYRCTMVHGPRPVPHVCADVVPLSAPTVQHCVLCGANVFLVPGKRKEGRREGTQQRRMLIRSVARDMSFTPALVVGYSAAGVWVSAPVDGALWCAPCYVSSCLAVAVARLPVDVRVWCGQAKQ